VDDAPVAAAAGGASVADLMIRRPKVLPRTATLALARASLADDHVHMVLLVHGDGGRDGSLGRLCGTLVRTDLPTGERDDEPALPYAALAGRTVAPDAHAHEVHQAMAATGVRRLAVVDDADRLLGLLCLKRHHRGFCDDVGVRARAAER